MKIQEIYTLLFENYDQLEAHFNDALAKYGMPRQVQTAIRESLDLGIIQIGESLIDAYKTLVKKNMLFGLKKPTDRDASYWASVFKKINEMNNTMYAEGVIDDFAYLILFSVKEIKERREAKEGKNDYEVIHKESNWVMFRADHKNAACSLGSNTKWCISARGDRNFFDEYASRGAEVYIIHARNDKFAILIRKGSNEIMEVQTSENKHGQPDPSVVKDFAKQMANAGVDIEKVESILKVTLMQNYTVESIKFKLGEDGIKPTPSSNVYDKMGIYKTAITISGKGGFREEYEDPNMIFVATRKDGGHDIAFMDLSDMNRPHKMYLMGEIDTSHQAIHLMKRNSDLFTNPSKEERYDEMMKNAIKRDLGVEPYKKLISADDLLSNVRGDT